MKNFICKSDSKKTIFYKVLLGMLTAAAFTLTSCQNFLNAKNVKEEIQDIIAYNNAKTITVSIACKEEMGSVLPSHSIQAKLGYDFDIQFIPNTQNYMIKDPTRIFEAVSWKDNSISRDDCVEFKVIEQSLEDKKSGLYRVKAKIIKDVDDIQIRPNCALLPCVVSVSPTPDSTEYNANTTVIITVNTPLENDGGEGVSIPYGEDGIKVKYGSVDMTNCFELPVLSSDHTKIIIQPKGDVLAAYMQIVPYVDITFTFGTGFKLTQNGTDIYFAQNENSSFTMKFNKTVEHTDPDLYGLFGSRSEVHAAAVPSYNAADFFLIQSLDDFDTSDEVIRNRVRTGFYLSGRAYDLDSGISRIEVVEHRIKDNDAINTTDSPEKPRIYTRENAEFVADENGNTYFSLYFPSKSKNGAIQITVTAYDGCGNHTSKDFIVFKLLFDENSIRSFSVKNGFLIDTFYRNYNKKFDEATVKSWLKRIHITPSLSSIKLYEIGETIDVLIPPSCLTYELVMDGTTESLPFNVYNQTDVEWAYISNDSTINNYLGYFDLPVDKVSGVSFVFRFADDMGNSFEKSYSIMNADDIGYLKSRTINDDGSYYVYTYYKPNVTSNTQEQHPEYVFLCDTTDEEGNPKKQFTEKRLPNIDYWCISNLGGFYTDFSDFLINSQSFERVETIKEINYEIGDELTQDNLATIEASITLIDSDLDFDYIYLSYYIPIGSIWENILFPENSLTHSFTINPNLINGSSIRTLVYSVKDGKSSKFKEKYINEGNTFNSALDTKAPSYTLSRSRYDYVLFKATDDSDDPDDLENPVKRTTGYIEFDKTGAKYYLENGQKKIPIYEFDIGDNYYSVSITDGRNPFSKTGNFSLQASGIMKNPRINYYSSLYHTLPAGWIFESTEFDNGFVDSRMFGDFYSFDSVNKKWNILQESTTSLTEIYRSYQDTIDGIEHQYVRINKPTELVANYGLFVKMVSYYYMSSTTGKEFWPVPFYFYADSSKRNSGNYDYIQTRSNTIFFVVSDAPTLVQTVVSQASDSYEDCKNWTAYEWLSHNKVVDERQYTFVRSDNPTPQQYQIEQTVLDKIKPNECYCVIAHFADGSTYVSDVFKKE